MRIYVDGLIVGVEPAGEARMSGIRYGPVAVTNVVIILMPFWDLMVG